MAPIHSRAYAQKRITVALPLGQVPVRPKFLGPAPRQYMNEGSDPSPRFAGSG